MPAPLLILVLLAGCAPLAPSSRDLVSDQVAPPVSPALDLDVTAVWPGQPATFTVAGLNPGERVTLLRSFGPPTAGPCPPVAGGLCLDIAAPVVVLGSRVADAAGTATLTVVVPSTAPVGLLLSVQAVAVRGAGGSASVKSQAVTREVGAALPTPVADLVVGDLVITEILQDPTVVADAVGEWFEVFNASGLEVDLDGLVVSDLDGESFAVSGPLVVGPDGFVVFGAELDPALNGGVPVDYAWSGFTLANADDELVLSVGSLDLDLVAWDDGATFPDPAGDSMSLDPAAWGAADNDDGSAWCASVTAGGTPGAMNDACPAPACGDGAVDPGEACDDGGVSPGDGCDALCQLEGCGVEELATGRWQTVSSTGYWTEAAIGRDGSVVVGGPATTGTRAPANVWAAPVGAASATWSSDLAYSIFGLQLRGLAVAPSGEKFALFPYDSGQQTGILKYGSDGAVLWRKYVGTSHSLSYDLYEDPMRAIPTSDGGLLVLGGVIDVHPAVAETYAQVKKVDANGALQWQRVWEHIGGGLGPPLATAAAELLDGGVLVGGEKPDLLRFDGAGNELWKLNAASTWEVHDMVVIPDGDILISGRHGTNRSPGLTRLRPDGTEVWSRVIAHSTPGSTSATRVTATPASCEVVPSPGGVCAMSGETCATTTDVCVCDGVWTCEPESQRFVLAWSNAGGSGSVPSGNSQVWSTFDSDGVLLGSRGLGSVGVVEAMAPEGRGLVSVAISGATTTVLRTTAMLDGGCSPTDYAGLTIVDSLSLSASVGPWYVPVGPEMGAAPIAETPAAVPTFTTTCSEGICP